MKELIKRLCETPGPSGHETSVRELIYNELKSGNNRDAFEVTTDSMGNLVVKCRGKGAGHTVMLAAHMDEIGVIASYIDEKGFVRFGAVGGVSANNLHGSRVRFGDGTSGVIGMEKLENSAKVPDIGKLFIDVGARRKEDCSVRIGDIAIFERPFEDLGNRLIAKAMDDRIGCAVLIQLLRELEVRSYDLHFVFTVQEEIGLRGATTSSYGIEPELALAVDVTSTGDTPEAETMSVSLGSGPAIKVKDSGMLAHPAIVDWLVASAEAESIPYQLEVLRRGTTDARAMQVSKAGALSGCVSIPCRYVHTPSEMVDYEDVRNAVSLLLAALSRDVERNS